MNNKGYSLIEILVVIGILGIVVGVGLIGLPRQLTKLQSKQKTIEIAHFLHYARQLAIATHEDQIFELSTQTLSLNGHQLHIQHPLHLTTTRPPRFSELGHNVPGSIYINHKKKRLNKVTLGFGYTKISWY